MDTTEGIVDRFRVMAISRASVLTRRVVGSKIRTLIAVVTLLTLALTWLAVALGMAAKSLEGANSSTLLLQFCPSSLSSRRPHSHLQAPAMRRRVDQLS